MSITRSARHAAAITLATGALTVGLAGPATADPAPNCTSADMAGIMSGVGFSLSGYLFTHPDVNQFFTSLKGLPKEQIRAKVQDYLAANPQVNDDIKAIRQPTIEFRSRCDISSIPAGVPVPAQP
ncbi:hemophore-related protein [Mycolicibacterium sp. BK556]|uniref:heme-binding protein n=1 Tax=unclassified Mycolicibacterium TaxID=2636767 RepID=UPI001613F0E4|nr:MULTISPECIES: heme-binding protein [unclassified Mycolicibacterium]MBB3606829.1 hemophore-related protein [Mycolicibacterium sp. BK556]MBB3636505.1 hemophore-related protein [Mycolicibacterium sp. BK607]MBB3754408.1 hemophore-related protein [Mycolicibacterium sp. BK634]